MLSKCACGSHVEIKAGKNGGLLIVCNNCKDSMFSLFEDRIKLESEWNEHSANITNSELFFIGRMKELVK